MTLAQIFITCVKSWKGFRGQRSEVKVKVKAISTLFSLHQRHLPPSILQSLVDFVCWLLCSTPAKGSWTQNLWKASKNSGPILSRLWTKVHEIFRRCKGLFILSKPLFIVIVFRSEDIRHIVEKPNKCIKFFGPQFFGRDNSNFSTANC